MHACNSCVRYKYAHQYAYTVLAESSIQASLEQLGDSARSTQYQSLLLRMDAEALNQAATFGRPESFQWVSYTINQDSSREVFEQLAANGRTTVNVPIPKGARYWNVRYRDVRAFVLPGDTSQAASSSVEFVQMFLVKGTTSAFYDEAGNSWTYKHPSPQPYQSNYRFANCLPLQSGSDFSSDTFISYSPYGSWEIIVDSPASTLGVFAAASQLRFEFEVSYQVNLAAPRASMFGGNSPSTDISFVSTPGGACTAAPQRTRTFVLSRVSLPPAVVIDPGLPVTTTPTRTSPTAAVTTPTTSTTTSPTHTSPTAAVIPPTTSTITTETPTPTPPTHARTDSPTAPIVATNPSPITEASSAVSSPSSIGVGVLAALVLVLVNLV